MKRFVPGSPLRDLFKVRRRIVPQHLRSDGPSGLVDLFVQLIVEPMALGGAARDQASITLVGLGLTVELETVSFAGTKNEAAHAKSGGDNLS